MKCPDCAETIQDDANKCRYCGREINEADRRGYPSFYRQILKHGFVFDRILDDYANHVESEGANRLNTENMAGNLLTWGKLDTFDLMRDMQDALFRRAFALIGKRDHDWRGGAVPSRQIEELFPEPGNEELKAVYLCGRFLTGIKDFGKSWQGGRDPRVDSDLIRFPIENLRELIVLARQAVPPMEDFAQMFESQIGELEEQIASIDEDGRTAGARFREDVLPQYIKADADTPATPPRATVGDLPSRPRFSWGKFALLGVVAVVIGMVLMSMG